MARMVFGSWASDEAKPAKLDHLRRPGNVTACGRKLTRGMLASSSPKLVTCPRCLATLKEAR